MTTAVYGASSYAWLAVGTVFSFDVDIPTLSFHECDCICIFFWLEYNIQTVWQCAQVSWCFRQVRKLIVDNCLLRESSVLNLCVFIVSLSYHVCDHNCSLLICSDFWNKFLIFSFLLEAFVGSGGKWNKSSGVDNSQRERIN